MPLKGMAARLLAVLLLERHGAVEREVLIDRLWAGDPPATAVTALHVHVGRLRRVLEPEAAIEQRWNLLRTTASGYELAPDPGSVDVDRYEREIATAKGLIAVDPGAAVGHLEGAERLWRGRPWAPVADEPWAQSEVTRFEELHRHAQELWAEANLTLGRHDVVLDHLRRAVDEEPFRERRWEQLIVGLYRAGRQVEALRAYGKARRLLREELGINPRPQLRRLERAVLVHDPSLDPFAPAPPSRRHNLPEITTALVGRDAERDDLDAELGRNRIVTLMGPGGIGKTRLALAVARDRVHKHADGAWLSNLSSVGSSRLVGDKLATDLGLRDSGEHATAGPEGLLEVYFADKDVLLLVDGCERIAAELARILARLLASCPGLTVLATSRAPLGIDGEVLLHLSPLALPNADSEGVDTMSSPAVRLFLDRAHEAGAAPYDESELQSVVRICRMVDALPLMIELTASHANALSPHDIELRLAAHGASASAATEWNVAMLAPGDQKLLNRLSAFPSGFTLSGAEAIGADYGLTPDETAGAITRLVSTSLIRFDVSSRPARYRMLELLRQQISRDFDREPEERAAADSSVTRYLQRLAERVRDDAFLGPPDEHALRLLDVEVESVPGVLDRLIAAGDGPGARSLATAMTTYWFERGFWSEGHRWLTMTMALCDSEPTLAHGRALVALARVTGTFSGIALHRDEIDEAIRIFETLGAETDLLLALLCAVIATGWSGDQEARDARFAQAQALAGRSEHDDWIRHVLGLYGGLGRALDGDISGAVEVLREHAEALRACGDRSLASLGFRFAGGMARVLGDLDGAQADLSRCVEQSDASGTPGTRAHALLTLSQIAVERDDPGAPLLINESIEALTAVGDACCVAECHATLGRLALSEDDVDDAAMHLQRALDDLARLNVSYFVLALVDCALVWKARGETERGEHIIAIAKALATFPGVPWSERERAHFNMVTADTTSPNVTTLGQAELVGRGLELAKRDLSPQLIDADPGATKRGVGAPPTGGVRRERSPRRTRTLLAQPEMEEG